VRCAALHCCRVNAADERDFRRDAEDGARLRRQRHKLLLRLPLYDALSELRAAAQRVHPNYNYMSSMRPVVAVKLELACPEPVERKRYGMATLKVCDGMQRANRVLCGGCWSVIAILCCVHMPAAVVVRAVVVVVVLLWW
jgi:hypothetical protein